MLRVIANFWGFTLLTFFILSFVFLLDLHIHQKEIMIDIQKTPPKVLSTSEWFKNEFYKRLV